jgi:hypothetical protein
VPGIPDSHRRFLLSFERGEPFNVPMVGDLPAVRWRPQNLASLAKDERDRFGRQLESILLADEAKSKVTKYPPPSTNPAS